MLWFLGFVFLAFMVLLPIMGVAKTIQYAAQGGLPKVVRCPACTEKQEAAANKPDYDCKRCGTPILRNGSFVQRQA